MDNDKIECLCVNCGITHELVSGEATLEPVDDGEFKVVTNCNCSECGEALITKADPAEEEPPELYG